MLAHHRHVRYRRLAVVLENAPPDLPPIPADSDVCGNCAGFRPFAIPCGGRCADRASPLCGRLVTRSVAGCHAFTAAAQRKLAV